EALRAAGWTDEDVMDIAEVAAMFNFTNRLASGLGWVPNDEFATIGFDESETDPRLRSGSASDPGDRSLVVGELRRDETQSLGRPVAELDPEHDRPAGPLAVPPLRTVGADLERHTPPVELAGERLRP